MTTQLDAPRARPTTPPDRDRRDGSVVRLTGPEPGTSAAAEARRFPPIEGTWPRLRSMTEEALFYAYRNVRRRRPDEEEA